MEWINYDFALSQYESRLTEPPERNYDYEEEPDEDDDVDDD